LWITARKIKVELFPKWEIKDASKSASSTDLHSNMEAKNDINKNLKNWRLNQLHQSTIKQKPFIYY
jgi:hypothetical protein